MMALWHTPRTPEFLPQIHFFLFTHIAIDRSDINGLKQNERGRKMRKITSLLAVAAFVMLIASCFAHPLLSVTNGLVGCWEFEEESGITALDSSGSGNDGLIVNATYSEDTPPQSLSTFTLTFNNTNSGNAYSYVTIPDSPV
jgi:hypothetical protein